MGHLEGRVPPEPCVAGDGTGLEFCTDQRGEPSSTQDHQVVDAQLGHGKLQDPSPASDQSGHGLADGGLPNPRGASG